MLSDVQLTDALSWNRHVPDLSWHSSTQSRTRMRTKTMISANATKSGPTIAEQLPSAKRYVRFDLRQTYSLMLHLLRTSNQFGKTFPKIFRARLPMDQHHRPNVYSLCTLRKNRLYDLILLFSPGRRRESSLETTKEVTRNRLRTGRPRMPSLSFHRNWTKTEEKFREWMAHIGLTITPN